MKLYPTKTELIHYLSLKMRNQDIAKEYGLHFQKVIQLIKKHQLDPNVLRKTDKFIVYEHHHKNKVIYVGSGLWYRCRRSSNRRNLEHRRLMEEGKIKYVIVGEFDTREEARHKEVLLIRKYKKIGQAKFNKQVK